MRDERGIALVWVAAAMPVILLLVVLTADILRWQALAHQLQTAADAAALAGAQEVWIRQEIDAAGVVWSQEVVLDAERAREQALQVLEANLDTLAPERFRPTAREVVVDAEERTVHVTVRGEAESPLAHRLGVLPPVFRRTGSAEPVLP